MAPFETVVHHRSELGEWETVGRGPHPALRGLVLQYSGWTERTTFTRRIEVPSPMTVLIIPFPQPLFIAAPREPATRRYNAFIGGLVDAFVVTEAPHGVGGGLQINFTPIGAYRLLGMPQHLLANAVIDAVELVGNPMRRLIDQVMDLQDWAQRIDAVEAFLLTRLAGAPDSTPGIEWAWRQLRASNGAVPIRRLAETLDLRPRPFIDLFRQEVGLAPKTMARVLRFNRVIEHLQQSSSVRWADLAAECGYYDQSHFVREFREFAGSTPSDFLGRKLPDGAGFLA